MVNSRVTESRYIKVKYLWKIILELHLLMKNILLSLAAWAAKILPVSFQQALYKIKRLAGLIRRSLNRAAPTGIVPVKVAGGDLAGYSILLDMQIDKDYWLGTYEPELQEAVRKLVKPGEVIYDVGANIGYVSLLLAKAAGETGKVYAFEALPENAERWRKNMELNGMDSRLCLIPKAVTQARRSGHLPGACFRRDGQSGRFGRAPG